MNTFFRSQSTDENQSGKRKTTMKNKILPARLLTAAIQLSIPLRRSGVVICLGLALGWLGVIPCARETCERRCGTIHNNTFMGNDDLVNNKTCIFNTASCGFDFTDTS